MLVNYATFSFMTKSEPYIFFLMQMGLGKTVQMIGLMLANRSTTRVKTTLVRIYFLLPSFSQRH